MKDEAVKLVGQPVMDDFGIMASQTRLEQGGDYCILPVIYHGSSVPRIRDREIAGSRLRRVTSGNSDTHRHSWRDPLDPPNPPTHTDVRSTSTTDKRGLHVYSMHVLLGYDMIQNMALV